VLRGKIYFARKFQKLPLEFEHEVSFDNPETRSLPIEVEFPKAVVEDADREG